MVATGKHNGQLGRRSLPALAPWAVLAMGLATTAWLTTSAYREMAARDEERFEHEVEHLVTKLETRLRNYDQALMGMRDWFGGQAEMTGQEWSHYVYTFHAPAHYPGLYNLGFAEFVQDIAPPPEFPKLEAHLKKMRERIGPEYKLTLPPGGAAGFSWYHALATWHTYSQWRKEPIREYRHYGMDLNQNPDLWAAMNWALGQDVPALSGKQPIDPDDLSVNGLMIFLPVYRPEVWLGGLRDQITGADRQHPPEVQREEEGKRVKMYQAWLRGLVFGGIDVQAFLRHHLGTNAPSVTFALYVSTNHLPSALPEQLLFDNRVTGSDAFHRVPDSTPTRPFLPDKVRDGVESVPTRSRRAVRDLTLYGRVLRFVAEPGSAFSSAVSMRTLTLAASFGVATTLLLSGFIAYQARAQRQERQTSEALRESERRLQALVREREQASRNLHDGVLQSLYALGLGLQKTRKVLRREPERAEEYSEQNIEALELVMGELRRHLGQTSRAKPPTLDPALAFTQLVQAMDRHGSVPVFLETDTEAMRSLPHDVALHLLQITREALANAQRYSAASRIAVRLERNDGFLKLRVEDDGVGFDLANLSGEGYGLRNMRTRAEEIGGEFTLSSQPGRGTRLSVQVPLVLGVEQAPA